MNTYVKVSLFWRSVSKLIRDLNGVITVTRYGKPVAVLMLVDDYYDLRDGVGSRHTADKSYMNMYEFKLFVPSIVAHLARVITIANNHKPVAVLMSVDRYHRLYALAVSEYVIDPT